MVEKVFIELMSSGIAAWILLPALWHCQRRLAFANGVMEIKTIKLWEKYSRGSITGVLAGLCLRAGKRAAAALCCRYVLLACMLWSFVIVSYRIQMTCLEKTFLWA